MTRHEITHKDMQQHNIRVINMIIDLSRGVTLALYTSAAALVLGLATLALVALRYLGVV